MNLHIRIIVVGALLVLTACITPRSSNLRLSLRLDQRERSKDSHWRTANLRIERGIAHYSTTHGGRDPRPDKKLKYALTQDREKRLIAFIRAKKLNRNIKEAQARTGIGKSIRLKLEIKIGAENTAAELVGMTNSWRRRKNASPSNLRNIDYYNRVRSLLVFLKRDLEYKEIEL